jgi:hypothetical protein
MLAGQCKRRMRGEPMTGFDWDVLAVGLAAGLGLSLAAVTALRLLTTRRRAQMVDIDSATNRRRIDVVAIDEGVERSPERQRNA